MKSVGIVSAKTFGAVFVFTAAVVACLALSANAGDYGSFRLMTFNICHCATHSSLSITDEDVQRTASVIAAENPDFVCLQEVDKETTRSDGIDETARFAELLTASTGTQWYGTFGKGRDYKGGEFGVAVLSKSEPLSVSTTPIEGSEPRSLLVCEFADFCVATVHLDTNRDYRTNSIPIIRNALAAISKPVFITGDWNATPTSDATLAQMKEFLTVISPESGIRTFGDIDGDDYVIDYIAVDRAHADKFYVKRGWCVTNKVGDEGSSDHNPVIVELMQRPAAADLAWIEENAVTTGMTGAWTSPVAYDAQTMKAELAGETTFSALAESGGTPVTVEVTASFDDVPEVYSAPSNTAQGGIWLGTNGVFQVWTSGGWVDVAAEGVTPTTGVDYTFRFVFDYATRKYSVSVLDGGAYKPLAAKGVSSFQLTTFASAVSGVRFTGDGVFTSLTGEYVAVEGFSEAETVLLKDNAEVVLDAAKAAWLNSCAGGKTAVGSAAAGLSAQEFSDAYLLNLDITDGDRSYSFEITDVDVGTENVTVAVTLTRSGNIAQSVNGVLKFYGAATLAAFNDTELEPLGGATLTNGDFSKGGESTAEITLEGETPPTFFKAKIEER